MTLLNFFFCVFLLRFSTVPLKMYMLLALIIMGSLGFTNASLEYLNYPAHIMFKTCNQIPVMIGGILILRKRYKLLDYIAILSMCIGLIWFTLTTYQSSPDFNILGWFYFFFNFFTFKNISQIELYFILPTTTNAVAITILLFEDMKIYNNKKK